MTHLCGRLAPGSGLDTGTPEIEVQYQTDATDQDQLSIDGAAESADQTFDFGQQAPGAIMANLNGDADADDIAVADANNLIFGGNQPGDAAGDVLGGGAGNDTVSFATQGPSGSTGPVSFSLDLALTGVPQATGGAGADTLDDSALDLVGGDPDTNHEVENLIGSPFGPDALTGNTLANAITAHGDGLADTVDCVAAADGDTALLDELLVDTASNCESVDNAPQTSYAGAGGTPNGATVSDTTPGYDVTADEPSTFQYRVGAGPLQACSGTCTVANALPDGTHVIAIRAVDADEKTLPDASPVSRTVTIDSTAPDTTASGPAKLRLKGKKKRATARYALGSSEPGSTLACSLDGGAFAPCNASHTAALRKGTHTLSVRATDPIGPIPEVPAVCRGPSRLRRRRSSARAGRSR